MHRRDRAALIVLRLTTGLLCVIAGANMLQQGWGADQLHDLFMAWGTQPVLAPELLDVVAWAEEQRFIIAPALLALHLLGGTLLLLGLLCRTTSLAIALTYGIYAAIDFGPAPVLLAVVGLALALSDAHHQLSLARPNHQSTETG